MAHKPLDRAVKAPAPNRPPETGREGHFERLLLDVAENRNKESFVQLFEHFAPRVKSFLMKGGSPEDVADELAQETMLTVWNKAPSFNPAQAGASTWIFTIARNRKIDALRKTGRFEVAPTDPDLIQSADSPRGNAMRRQEIESIAGALDELPEEQAMLLRQSFFEDKSHADIAEETGLPLGTVKSRIRLALERLRKNKTIKELWQ
ncbi:MAG: sigma-70 family RNA polymerase sigma factor [Alphaproteobacteria bacterium PRO2]|nr:sigma-70 family RNA polymerase sigma factor [Alphaproteobacteria bacterium PRO2]